MSFLLISCHNLLLNAKKHFKNIAKAMNLYCETNLPFNKLHFLELIFLPNSDLMQTHNSREMSSMFVSLRPVSSSLITLISRLYFWSTAKHKPDQDRSILLITYHTHICHVFCCPLLHFSKKRWKQGGIINLPAWPL